MYRLEPEIQNSKENRTKFILQASISFHEVEGEE